MVAPVLHHHDDERYQRPEEEPQQQEGEDPRNLARRIDAVCVAEGIETPQDLEECRRLGIPFGQGFYLAVPEEVPARKPARRIEPEVPRVTEAARSELGS